jgi:hypothetical protein
MPAFAVAANRHSDEQLQRLPSQELRLLSALFASNKNGQNRSSVVKDCANRSLRKPTEKYEQTFTSARRAELSSVAIRLETADGFRKSRRNKLGGNGLSITAAPVRT